MQLLGSYLTKLFLPAPAADQSRFICLLPRCSLHFQRLLGALLAVANPMKGSESLSCTRSFWVSSWLLLHRTRPQSSKPFARILSPMMKTPNSIEADLQMSKVNQYLFCPYRTLNPDPSLLACSAWKYRYVGPPI